MSELSETGHTDAHSIKFNEQGVPTRMFNVSKMKSTHHHVSRTVSITRKDDAVVLEIADSANRALGMRIPHVR